LPVFDHTIEVSIPVWKKLLPSGVSHPIQSATQTYSITRRRLLTHSYASPEDKCLEILMWGYASGGRGNNISNALRNLKNIAVAAAAPQPTWSGYCDGFGEGWGVGPSTISKFAYFFGHKFGGNEAVILDQRIADTLNAPHWKFSPRSVGSYPWANTYPSYLADINSLARSLGVRPDQIELFLYLLGPHFR